MVFYSYQTCRVKSLGFGDHFSSSTYFLCENQLEKYNSTPNQAGEGFRCSCSVAGMDSEALLSLTPH